MTRPAPVLPTRKNEQPGAPVGSPVIAWIGGALALGAAVVLVPFWAPLLLAAWTAQLLQRPYRRLGQKLGDRHRGAAFVTVALLIVLLVLPPGMS